MFLDRSNRLQECYTNLAGEFHEHKSQYSVKKTKPPKLSTLVQYSYALFRNPREPPSSELDK